MKPLSLYTRLIAHACVALLLMTSVPAAAVAQRRRHATRPRPRPNVTAPTSRPNTTTTSTPQASTHDATSAPKQQQTTARRAEPDISIEEMLAADTYSAYTEVRRVGTLAQTEELKTAVASLGLYGGVETKPLTDLYKFVLDNAEALGESRFFAAYMPARVGVPQVLVAVELESPEAAVAFEPKFRRLLGEQVREVRKAIDPASVKPEPPAQAQAGARQRTETKPPAPDFALKRVGRWLIAADSPFTLKGLGGEEGEQRLADSTRFQSVRGRFANDALFIYVDTNVAQQGWALQMQRANEAQAAAAKQPEVIAPTRSADGSRVEMGAMEVKPVEPTPQATTITQTPTLSATITPPQSDAQEQEAPTPAPIPEDGLMLEDVTAPVEGRKHIELEVVKPPEPTEEELAVRGLSGVIQSLWGGAPRIPGAVALGVGLDRGALAVRLAVENTPDGTIALIPFLPNLVSGPPVTGETAAVAPADSELFFAASLDWTQVYNSTLGTAAINPSGAMFREDVEGDEGKGTREPTAEQSIAAIEKLFGFKFKEDLLPALGNEVAFSMPLNAGDFGIRASRSEEKKEEVDAEPGFLYIASLNNPDKVREILPRVLVAFGLVEPSATGRPPEKRAGFEIRAAGSLSYSIINNFLVLGEPKAVRHCIDSYDSRQTLAASNAYRDSTAWQAKQKLAHVFISDTIMKSINEATRKRSGASTDPVIVALLTQMETAESAPASYEATNEGDVVVHEMRVPLSLIKSYVLAMTVAVKDAPITTNEAMATYALNTIAYAESSYKDEKKKGRYGTLEELAAEKLLENGFMEHLEYKIELSASGDKFEATATPKSYGKTGRLSFFVNESGTVRAADHKGQPATPDDPPSEQ
jgi:hypothetical protein